MNALEVERFENHYCSNCLGTRKFVVKGNVEECRVCRKRLYVVAAKRA
jgi:predicted nucleotidyltransferase